MTTWREGVLKTVIIAIVALLVAAGVLLWALLFFRGTL
jgi:hypothetical protein